MRTGESARAGVAVAVGPAAAVGLAAGLYLVYFEKYINNNNNISDGFPLLVGFLLFSVTTLCSGAIDIMSTLMLMVRICRRAKVIPQRRLCSFLGKKGTD